MSKCLGVILAGGQSSRMGEDKAYLKRGEQEMLCYTKELLESLNMDVVVSGQQGIVDVVPDCGPLGGIYSVLKQHSQESVLTESVLPESLLIVPVDMPLLTSDLLAGLLEAGKKVNKAVCYQDCYLPLYLPLSTKAIDYLLALFESDNPPSARLLSLRQLLSHIGSIQLPIEQNGLLANTNTPEQWEAALASLSDKKGH